MKQNKAWIHYSLIALLFIGVFSEISLQTFWQNKFGSYLSPVLWMASGFLTCLAAFLLIGFKQNPIASLRQSPEIWRYAITFGLYAFGAIWCGVRLHEVYLDFPVDPKGSDIIPSLELYVKRFLGGEKVYVPMVFEGWTVNPTYFPMLWMPYIFSEIAQIDYRWTAYGVFLLAILIYQIRLLRQDLPWYEVALKTLLPFLFVYNFAQNARGTLGFAVELLPVGFYLLLTSSLFHRSKWLMALGIVICLLSRYAFTFWLPLYLLIYWIEYGFKNVFQVSLYVLLGVLVLYVLPFLLKDPSILTNGLAYYGKTAEGQWYPQAWQQPGDIPHHLNKGLSTAMYFYDDVELTIPDRLARNRKVHIAACAFAALLLGFGYFFFRRRGLNTKLYLLIGLKFYLVVFYGFFYVPFSYLYQLPLFLSLALIYHISLARPSTST